MSGVYGDMLLAFPEQFRSLSIYEMRPLINGGWEKVVDLQGKLITQEIIGVFQNTLGGGLKDGNGNLVRSDGRELWTKTGDLDGKFVTWDGFVYRIKDTNKWSHEGGFHRYGLEKVVGNDGSESGNTTWNIGSNNFG